MILNKGFDILQVRAYSRKVFEFPYRDSWRYGLWDAVTHPGAAIERYGGTRRWLRNEVLPLSFNSRDAAWVVNWTEHFIFGGLTNRQLEEWYAFHGARHPRIYAAAVTMFASAMNEITEHPHASPGNASAGTVADFMIFDPLGILFFMWDRPVKFFSQTLQAADWVNMASLTLPNGELQNNGQWFVFKVPLPVVSTRIFLRGGLGAQVGLTQRIGAEHALSFGLGRDTETRRVDSLTTQETVEFARVGGGIYLDRNNSVLANVNIGAGKNRLVVNVYPGVLPAIGEELGAWLVVTSENELRIGVAARRTLGVGLGYGR